MFAVCGGFHFPRVSRQSASDHFAFCAFIFVYLFICICVFVYLYLFICLFVFMYLCICIHRGFHSSRVSQQSAPLHLSFCQNGVFFTATSSVTTKSLFETKFVNLKASDNSYGILCLQCFRKYHLIIIWFPFFHCPKHVMLYKRRKSTTFPFYESPKLASVAFQRKSKEGGGIRHCLVQFVYFTIVCFIFYI